MHLLDLIIPLDHKEAANKMCIAMGWGEGTFDPDTRAWPVSPSGEAPATHMARRAWATPGTIAILANGGVDLGEEHAPEEPSLPPVPWAAFDLTEQEVWGALGALIAVKDSSQSFDALLAEHGLKRVVT